VVAGETWQPQQTGQRGQSDRAPTGLLRRRFAEGKGWDGTAHRGDAENGTDGFIAETRRTAGKGLIWVEGGQAAGAFWLPCCNVILCNYIGMSQKMEKTARIL
jgi:hypothetical protein